MDIDLQAWHEVGVGRLRTWWQHVERRLPSRASRLLRRLVDRDLILAGSSLAFYGLISALPLLMLSFAAVEAVAGQGVLQRFAERAGGSGPQGSRQFLDQLVRDGGSLTVATVLFTVWPATSYGGGLRRALLRSTDRAGTLPGLEGRVLGLSVVLVLPAMLLAGIPLMYVLTSLSGDGVLGTVAGWLLALGTATLAGTMITSLIYHVFGPVPLGGKESLEAAMLTAALSAVFSLGFVVYLDVADTEERFGGGTVAIVVLLGVWLLVTNLLLLAGYHVALELNEVDDNDSGGGSRA